MLQVQRSKSAIRAQASSIASTDVSLAGSQFAILRPPEAGIPPRKDRSASPSGPADIQTTHNSQPLSASARGTYCLGTSGRTASRAS
jgi:hypothetical protein